MNLGLEYLVRSGLIKDFFQTPCSLYLKCDRNKKVIIFLERCNKKIIRHWNIFQCNCNAPLPPMLDYSVDDFFSNPYAIPDGYLPIPYADQPTLSRANTCRHPMDNDLYEGYHDSLLNSWRHNRFRQRWLWITFLNVYNIETYRFENSWKYLSEHSIMLEEQDQIHLQQPKRWKYWQMWTKYMLPSSITPGELVFAKC